MLPCGTRTVNGVATESVSPDRRPLFSVREVCLEPINSVF